MKLSENLSLLISPTDLCNMNCVYCYHRPNKLRGGIMSLETVKKIYDATFSVYPRVQIIWHGGEPLLCGIDFFRAALELQKNYSGVKIRNSVQTNLTLMTDELADFFTANKIHVGSSFDGLQNDFLRGATAKIFAGREKLLRRGESCGFITVISAKNIDYLPENYALFKRLGQDYTFNLYIPAKGDTQDPLRLNPETAAKKIIEFYKIWSRDGKCRIRVNFFERIAQFVLTGRKTLCNYTGCLGKWLGVRHNGEIFPCNRFFPPQYSFGNVHDHERIDQAFESAGFELILTEAIERREKCKACPAFELCEGGCNNLAYNENGVSDNGGANCQIFRTVYEFIRQDLKNLRADDKNKLSPRLRR